MSRKPIIIVASLVVAGLAATGFATFGRNSDRPITVTAQFEDTVGLYQGNSVAVLGMPVGSVTSIVSKDTYVEVTLTIDKGVDIPADAQAVTVSTSILTDRHIELTPAYQGGAKLHTGDVIGLGRTRTPVEFDRTLAMVDKLSTALRGDGNGAGPIADLINVGSQINATSGPQIKATLDQLSQALRLGSDNGMQSKKDIQAIVTSLATLTQEAADNDASIREFGANLRQLSDILAAQDLGTGSTGAKINDILAQTTTLLEQNRDGLKSTARDYQTITTAMVDYQRELAEFFDVTPMTVDNVWNTLDLPGGAVRAHLSADKIYMQSQMSKEICNLIGAKQLGCATGALRDYGPDFGVPGMLELLAGAPS
ncbi:MCE family protein [[Mycobacterium] nativiensis]|uniref:MCE family protein n=1 Tax=[Mycobacterium] nativiensis TaxID=2855503 RepID=A0ABU5XV08_9MYCO|nr:MCE family protein [Mycolicibacter sp. MYC340]MEB3031824.1 MCE family protein [Mycolicibacter sp. MYC340]